MITITVDAERLREVCERYGVARLEVFGSVSRGEDKPDSDIDLLYVLKPEATPDWTFYDLEGELAAILGRPVDLVPKHAINKYLRERVLQDAKPFYAA
jgi:uncharacterized protein